MELRGGRTYSMDVHSNDNVINHDENAVAGIRSPPKRAWEEPASDENDVRKRQKTGSDMEGELALKLVHFRDDDPENASEEELREQLRRRNAQFDSLLADVQAKGAEIQRIAPSARLKEAAANQLVQIADAARYGDGLDTESEASINACGEWVKGRVQTLERQKEEAETILKRETEERRRLHEHVMDLKGNIRVFARSRPLMGDESPAVFTSGARENELHLLSGEGERANPKAYRFDAVFSGSAPQEEVFREVRPIVTSVLDGYNAVVLAYGQTGSGKTFTMEGPTASLDDASAGVAPRTMQALFAEAKERAAQFDASIAMSVLEIYNEQVHDLLAPQSTKLELRQTSEGGTVVKGLAEEEVKEPAEAIQALEMGKARRATEATSCNSRSSRSHLAMRMTVRTKPKLDESNESSCAELWLVDLAGSERVSKSQVSGDRLREAQQINKSLSALGECVHALVQQAKHVPYRNSKLTQLLQGSLGGNAKALLIAHVSPSGDDAQETACTLNFASRARHAERGAAKKQEHGPVRMRQELETARSEIESLKKQLADAKKEHSARSTSAREADTDNQRPKAAADHPERDLKQQRPSTARPRLQGSYRRVLATSRAARSHKSQQPE